MKAAQIPDSGSVHVLRIEWLVISTSIWCPSAWTPCRMSLDERFLFTHIRSFFYLRGQNRHCPHLVTKCEKLDEDFNGILYAGHTLQAKKVKRNVHETNLKLFVARPTKKSWINLIFFSSNPLTMSRSLHRCNHKHSFPKPSTHDVNTRMTFKRQHWESPKCMRWAEA